MITVHRYDNSSQKIWNDFNLDAKNGHFMFDRGYMDYHSDRFFDYSLMFFDEKERLIAVLPANLSEGALYSHQGLTFGGLLLSKKITTEKVYEIFSTLIGFLKEKSEIRTFKYKRIPDFYHTYPAQEDLYALFLFDAKLFRRDVSVAVELAEPYAYQEMRKRKVKKAVKSGVEVSENASFGEYWELLTEVLNSHHGAQPAHSLEEIEMLHTKFPKNIRPYMARLDGELVAGAIVYETDLVAHTQYLASSDKGRELGALDVVIDHLIKNVYKDKRYFDFGISTEDNGRTLNRGLIAQKEGFGARALVHDFYEINLR